MIKTCWRQVRAVPGSAYGLDYGAVMTVATARGADAELVADLLPRVEPHILSAWNREADDAHD